MTRIVLGLGAVLVALVLVAGVAAAGAISFAPAVNYGELPSNSASNSSRRPI